MNYEENELVFCSKNGTSIPLTAGKFSDTNFWHYTSLQSFFSIINSRKMFLSNLENMNDIDERNLHKDEGKDIFCLSFCNSDTEKIPMWYLYSGITGKGVSLGITPYNMIQLFNSIQFVTVVDNNRILKREEDFDLFFGWVIYRKTDDATKVKYLGKKYTISNDDISGGDLMFIKSYPWEYEKEFRIIIKNKTREHYKKLAIDISGLLNYKIKVKLAPEINSVESLDVQKRLSNILDVAPQVIHSSLGIKMDLLKRNYQSFNNFFALELKKQAEKRDIDINELLGIICGSPFCRRAKKE